jgi:eukaryotic-like serine/threonine-protein kinase
MSMTEPSATNVAYWQKLNALLEQALALPAEQRGRWLETLEPEFADIKPALGEMLRRGAVETDAFLATALPLRQLAGAPLDAPEDQPGDHIGPYLLLRFLGKGGMGSVWLAQRSDGSLKRQVALKLPHIYWAGDLAKRIRRERDILASLEHRNIARLYDAGVSAQGRPYLALEYVDGEPIDVYCRQQNLDVAAKLRLFLQVARAVSYAHGRLIVHRDLKPGNVLVTAQGGAKLLDFGVAKLLQGSDTQDATLNTLLTQAAGVPLTPSYASPEQIRAEPITVASDVYSLGVMLYELLTGQRPYTLKNHSAAALEIAVTQSPIGLASNVTSGALSRALRGDIDTILAKALKRDPALRYRSADAFADDIERHLAGEPVLARPDSLAYRARKFVRRNRAAVFASVMTCGSLLAGGGLAAVQWQQAVAQRDRANALLARNSAIIELNSLMLADTVGSDLAPQLAGLFASGHRLAPVVFKDQPERTAGALQSLADFYASLPDYKKALEILDQAAVHAQSSHDADLKMSIDCSRARWLTEIGRRDQAKRLFAQLDSVRNLAPETRLDCLRLRGYVARAELNKAPALAYAQHGVETLKEIARPSPLQTIAVTAELAASLDANGQRAEAEKQYLWALAQVEQLGLADTVYARGLHYSLGLMNYRAGNFLQGIGSFEKNIASIKTQNPTAEIPPGLLHGRGLGHENLANYPRALADYQQAEAAALRHNQNGVRLYAMVGQAGVYERMGKLDDAQRVLDAMPAVDANSAVAPIKTVVQARIELGRGRTERAREMMQNLVHFMTAQGSVNQPLVISLRTLSSLKLAQGDVPGAQAAIDHAMQVSAKQQAGKPFSAEVGLNLLQSSRVAQVRGDATGAQAALRLAVQHLDATLGEKHPEAVLARTLLQ